MLEAFALSETADNQTDDTVELTYQERQKSRHKTQTQSGAPLGWFLERGHVLADGERLLCSNGKIVQVQAALEPVSQVESADKHLLMRAAYHLGNRHVPLQIDENFLRYQHDHVLDAMLVGLGLTVGFTRLPFHPENGAYHGQSHGHSHSHAEGHNHAHSHSHA